MDYAAVLAVLLVPMLVARSRTLASKPSVDGKAFRPSPPLRALYPGTLVAFTWGVASSSLEAWEKGFSSFGFGDWFGLVGMLVLFLVNVFSWPVTIVVTDDGLKWRRLLVRRLIPWSSIKNTVLDMVQALIIFDHSDKRYEVSQFIEGRPQLKTIIDKKIRELKSSSAGGMQ